MNKRELKEMIKALIEEANSTTLSVKDFVDKYISEPESYKSYSGGAIVFKNVTDMSETEIDAMLNGWVSSGTIDGFEWDGPLEVELLDKNDKGTMRQVGLLVLGEDAENGYNERIQNEGHLQGEKVKSLGLSK